MHAVGGRDTSGPVPPPTLRLLLRWYLARRNITLARSKVTGNTDIEYEVRYYLDLIELSLEASYITNVYVYIYIDAAIVSVLT
jgi:hypothetical protein